MSLSGRHPTEREPVNAEAARARGFGKLEDGLLQASDWYLWGPYPSERQWGTVREDYSADGQAWDYFSHDQSRSRAYRWGEDGMAGFSDIEQRLCIGLAVWNGHDPILKERVFGLTGDEGNHGEDVKDYWWYVDAVPSHSWNVWRYHYPQRPFPYTDLVSTNRTRTRQEREYELVDTGVFDEGRYWVIEVTYAKSNPDDLLMRVRATNAGPDAAPLHVLPSLWYRNTWSWDGGPREELRASSASTVSTQHPLLGDLDLIAGNSPDGSTPTLLFCENETNLPRVFGAVAQTPYPKDGIGDHVIAGASTVNPDNRGSKCAVWHRLEVAPGATAEVRLRLRRRSVAPGGDLLGGDFTEVLDQRLSEADEFYKELTPTAASPDEAAIMRQAFAGMLWGKQHYYYDVDKWLDGDRLQPTPPSQRLQGRNARWRHFDAFDIMSMPDKWEYPWFASWDLAFHCVALAHVDPAFAKYQLILLCREWFQHRNGALPAYEWDFGDVNPPVQAWAALEVFLIDGGTDVDFLSRVFDKLLINFTWWVNREDRSGSDVYEGGFLGLDNIGPIDRSHLATGMSLKQSDATGWMAFYSLTMAGIAAALHQAGQRTNADLVVKFLENFAAIRAALDAQGLWDDADGMFYDRLTTPTGEVIPLRVRSMVGVIPLLAAVSIDETLLDQTLIVSKRFSEFFEREHLAEGTLAGAGLLQGEPGARRLLVSAAAPDQVQRVLHALFDESEFLSPHGLRSISAFHRDRPFELDLDGSTQTVRYEPGESSTAMFGGNSNWRGPIWFPLNVLVISALERYHRFFGSDAEFEYPTGSGSRATLDVIAGNLRGRLISLFSRGDHGTRAFYGGFGLQDDPAWKDLVWFNEYFHGDTGEGLGASHQTGWTGLVADAIRRRYSAAPDVRGALTRRGSAKRQPVS